MRLPVLLLLFIRLWCATSASNTPPSVVMPPAHANNHLIPGRRLSTDQSTLNQSSFIFIVLGNKSYVPCSTYRDCARINGHTKNECFNLFNHTPAVKVCTCLSYAGLRNASCGDEARCTSGPNSCSGPRNWAGNANLALSSVSLAVSVLVVVYALVVAAQVCRTGMCSRNVTSTTLVWVVLSAVVFHLCCAVNLAYIVTGRRELAALVSKQMLQPAFSIVLIAAYLTMPIMWLQVSA